MTERADDRNPESSGDPREELRHITAELRAVLEWQLATGATGLPRDPATPAPGPELPAAPAASALAQRSPAQRSTTLPSTAAAAPAAPAPAGRAADSRSARALPTLQVAEARTLDELERSVRECRACRLCEARKQTVFSRGTGKNRIAFVGEGPGADEDAQGLPFVGAAGQLLDRMIAGMGLERDDVYVANVVKCRPPNNRKPEAEEMAACLPYLHRQLELVDPEVIVLLGATPLEGLLGKTGIKRSRGQFQLYRGKTLVMPTFHPAYLLREPSAKRDVWSDLKQVLERTGRSIPEKRPKE